VGVFMTIKEFKDIIESHNIPDDAEIIMNDGGGGDSNNTFPIDGVFYSQKRNEIVLVYDELYAYDYLGNEDWICLNVAENEKDEFFIANFIEKSRGFNEFKFENYKEYLEFIDKNKKIICPQKLGLKLLVFTDPEEIFEIYEEEIQQLIKDNSDFDLCVLIGESSNLELKWLLQFMPKEKIIAVTKNGSSSSSKYKENGICDISYSMYHKEGVEIHGLSSFYYGRKIEFCTEQFHSFALRLSPFKSIDVFVSYDAALLKNENKKERAGIIGITDYIYSNKVQYHIHKGSETYERQYDNGTKDISVNKFVCVEI
jgi:hypothetical protein